MPTDPFAPMHLHTVWKREDRPAVLPNLDPALFGDDPDWDSVLFGDEPEEDTALTPGLMVAFLCVVAVFSFMVGAIVLGLALLIREAIR